MDYTDRSDRNPALAELLDDAFVEPVDLDTASRHLWVIHSEAQRIALEAEDEVDAPVSLASRRLPRAAVPVLALVMLMSMSGVAVAASQGSLPGDALYHVKRGTERAQLIFVRDPVTRAELQLSFARTRLDEIQQIAVTRPQHVPELVEQIAVTLVEVEHGAPEVAARVQPVSESIRRETTESIAQLQLPVDVNQAVEVAMTPTAAPGTATATPVPSTNTPATAPSESKTPQATAEPKDTDGDGIPDTPVVIVDLDGDGIADDVATAFPTPTGTASPSASPQPTDSASATPTPTPTGSASEPAPSGSPNPSASPGPTSPATGQPSTGPSATPSQPAGPVVTARPQPSEGEAGDSRSDDEDADNADPQPTASDPEPVPTGSSASPTPSDPEPQPSATQDDPAGPSEVIARRTGSPGE